ncbi:hypothetical protein HM1_0729 [Heliomicrobium modesticaldum Ice1]|uniref:Phage phiEco32-like COOH.NH2 ligase-type 2 n=1 Tax=Heliobacterium modesticaldum (strain ATCC 51547 / Ice1) TaxID=498761 RepID=B0TB99_HELMI|nr:hypothetical protein [Heliomicrobium modesticaldum]ABZ83826.1 hypothetical protein HM1_0729 [Heliomicrobium modesticaldum Ice1]
MSLKNLVDEVNKVDLLVLHPNRLSARRLADALGCRHSLDCPIPPPQGLIRFGTAKGVEGSRFTVNPRAAIIALRNPAALYQLHRLPYGARKGAGRTLTIHVVDGQVIALSSSDTFSRLERQKCTGMALRALYLAGADFGAVSLAVPVRGTPRVTKVTTAPLLTPELAAAYARAIIPLIERKRGGSEQREITADPAAATGEASVTDVTLGADPEFMFKHSRSGRLVPANRFFQTDGPIGCDRRKAIAEIRPAPKTAARELTQAIGALLAGAAAKVRKKPVRMLAGAMPLSQFPIGGHIHFGGLPLTFPILRALDNYLLIPLFLIERGDAAIRRRKYYGYIGDVRLKGPDRFEYRSPSSWLVSPAITLATLSLAKLIVEQALHLPRNLFSDGEAIEAFYAGDKEYFRRRVAGLRQDLESLPGYEAVAGDILPLWRMIDEGREWDDEVDLRQVWRIET